MVMEKHRDIAVLMSMGAKRAQIRKIFVLEGLLIGGVGTVVGLVLGYSLSLFCERIIGAAGRRGIFTALRPVRRALRTAFGSPRPRSSSASSRRYIQPEAPRGSRRWRLCGTNSSARLRVPRSHSCERRERGSSLSSLVFARVRTRHARVRAPRREARATSDGILWPWPTRKHLSHKKHMSFNLGIVGDWFCRLAFANN